MSWMRRSLTLLVLLHPRWHLHRVVLRLFALVVVRVVVPNGERVWKRAWGRGREQKQWIDHMEVHRAVEDQVQ